MKSKEEIEQLAKSKFITNKNISLSQSNKTMCRRSAFVKGYTQCQEDIVEELKEWIEITLSAESKLGASDSVIEALLGVKYKIESLKKQD